MKKYLSYCDGLTIVIIDVCYNDIRHNNKCLNEEKINLISIDYKIAQRRFSYYQLYVLIYWSEL